MKNIVAYELLEKLLKTNRADTTFRFRAQIVLLNSVVILTFSYFVYFNIWIDEDIDLAVYESIAIFINILIYYFVLIKNSLKISAFLLQIIISVICTITILTWGNQGYSLILSLITPVSAIYLLGTRNGSYLSLLNFLFLVIFSYTNLDVWTPAPFEIVSFTQIILIYLCIWLICAFFDSTREFEFNILSSTNEKLFKQATTDTLTRLPNRRYIEDFLLEEDNNGYIAFIDIDDFKSVNDEHGHLIGDQVLQQLGKILRHSLGENEKVARWGGEEFIWISHSQNFEEVKEKLYQLTRRIHSADFDIGRRLSVSIGASIFSKQHYRESLNRADQALYSVKAQGKNNVEIYPHY